MVQSNVHSTSVGAEKTIKFISQLLEDLEDCIDEFLHENLVEKLILSHEQEVELGTLLSASCLTIRYVTEREAFLRFLPRFRATFLAVVRSENWHRSLMGLKMVALMGCTRLLESFGEFTGLEIVLTDLEWFYGLIVESSIETKLHYLLRPICEYIGVSIQTHPEACIFIYGELLGALLRLVTKSKEVLTLSIENTQELVNTIAVLLDMKLAPLPNALSLLSMPSFIQRQEEEGDDGEVENELSYERNFVITSTTKNIDSKLLLEMSECLIRIIQKKLEDKLTIACLPALVLLWRFACQDLGISIASVGLQNCIHTIIQTQESLELKTLMDYELFQVSLETLRDLLLSFQTEIPLLSQIFDQLANVMPCLENSIRQLDKQLVRQAKPMCSSIRQVLVEAFVAFIHASGNGFRQFSNDFLGVSAGKLADPRVFGDVLYSLRHCKNDEEAAFACEKILNQLTSALKQLERYSKEAQGRILCAISRVAFVYTQYAMEPHQLTDLGQFLLGSLVDCLAFIGRNLKRLHVFYLEKASPMALKSLGLTSL
jgi:hypothetical protein